MNGLNIFLCKYFSLIISIAACKQNHSNQHKAQPIESLNTQAAEKPIKKVKPIEYLNYNQPLTTLLPTHLDKNKVLILIEKSKYQLTVLYDNQPVKTYPVVFGPNPVDDKLQEGDGRTPEGEFKIQDLYPHPSWSKFIWLNYPTPDSWKKHNQARREGKLSSQSTIGGEIGIHGVPEDDSLIEQKTNWTTGCISLKNKDVNELYSISKKGTVVRILH